MKCCLCPNEDSLLIELREGHSLSLCPIHEGKGLFEVAAKLAVENERLRELVEKLRNCMNCKHDLTDANDPDVGCKGCLEGYTKWESTTSQVDNKPL